MRNVLCDVAGRSAQVFADRCLKKNRFYQLESLHARIIPPPEKWCDGRETLTGVAFIFSEVVAFSEVLLY